MRFPADRPISMNMYACRPRFSDVLGNRPPRLAVRRMLGRGLGNAKVSFCRKGKAQTMRLCYESQNFSHAGAPRAL
jgi:hypothetical protein